MSKHVRHGIDYNNMKIINNRYLKRITRIFKKYIKLN